MASIQPEEPKQSKTASHGRGGAGNINNKPSTTVGADDLQTPTLKSAIYTTGRGGSGNMMSNDSAENARMAQDIDAPKHHQNEPKGTYHWGRGGEGNMVTVGQESTEGGRRSLSKSKERRPSKGTGDKARSGSFQNAVNKGREILGLKDQAPEKGGSAIEDD